MKGWDPVWGGALELFPVENGNEVGLPGVKSVKRVDVKWGQIVFFEVCEQLDPLISGPTWTELSRGRGGCNWRRKTTIRR